MKLGGPANCPSAANEAMEPKKLILSGLAFPYSFPFKSVNFGKVGTKIGKSQQTTTKTSELDQNKKIDGGQL